VGQVQVVQSTKNPNGSTNPNFENPTENDKQKLQEEVKGQ
jgi:hypothetical protein